MNATIRNFWWFCAGAVTADGAALLFLGAARSGVVLGCCGVALAVGAYLFGRGEGRAKGETEDERRQLACLVACCGISTESLEAGRLGEALEMLGSVMVEDGCDGQEPRCPSCAALNLLRALGRRA